MRLLLAVVLRGSTPYDRIEYVFGLLTSLHRYDLDRIVCGKDPKTTLVPILDDIAAVGSKVLLDLRAEVATVMQTNRTSDWQYLRSIIDAVQNHAAVRAT